MLPSFNAVSVPLSMTAPLGGPTTKTPFGIPMAPAHKTTKNQNILSLFKVKHPSQSKLQTTELNVKKLQRKRLLDASSENRFNQLTNTKQLTEALEEDNKKETKQNRIYPLPTTAASPKSCQLNISTVTTSRPSDATNLQRGFGPLKHDRSTWETNH